MNKPNSIHQFSVFNRTTFPSKPVQTITLKFIGGRAWLNTSNNKQITLRPTNVKNHYLAIGKNKREYLLVQYTSENNYKLEIGVPIYKLITDTRTIESKLASKYGYKPLPAELSAKYRNFFWKNIPETLRNAPVNTALFNKNGVQICSTFDRIVIGDYGAFVEFSSKESNFIVQPGQEFRLRPSFFGKYHWLTTPDNSQVKIYFQIGTVKYADYKIGKFYVSVHEVFLK